MPSKKAKKQPSPWIVGPHILIDQREQLPYDFESMTPESTLKPHEQLQMPYMEHLQTGDYSLAGFQGQIAVERKSLPDLYSTLGKGRERFEDEMHRLSLIPHAFVVVEASIHSILFEPPVRSLMLPKAVYRSIVAWMLQYPTVHWIPCDSRELAEATTYRVLERFWRNLLAEIKLNAKMERLAAFKDPD